MATRLSPANDHKRTTSRQLVTLPARLTWKDASGAVRFTSVTTRDISEAGAFVEADNAAAIPLYRIVHLQLERGVRDIGGLPEQLREGRVRSAIWRVGPRRSSRGTPGGYALRFLVDPGVADHAVAGSMAVAS
jgi:PilZ domain-containing protein